MLLYPKIREVLKGEFYRSKQPEPEDLEEFHDEYGILTVVNLRGEKIGEKWFEKERAVCEKLGLGMYNVEVPIKIGDDEHWLREF